MLDFYRRITVPDESGIRHMEYDICPEQGPVTKDSMITTAAVKQMAVYALRAAEILGRPEEERMEISRLLQEMPEDLYWGRQGYTVLQSCGQYGLPLRIWGKPALWHDPLCV